jgi:hypothetical protein
MTKPPADLIAKYGLTFPVGFGADARVVADLTGAFVNPEPVYLQSTGFVLDPQGKVVVSVYSSGAIGRLVPEDIAGLVRYVREHAATTAWAGGGEAGKAVSRCPFGIVAQFSFRTGSCGSPAAPGDTCCK